MTSCHNHMNDHPARKPPPVDAIIKGVGGFSLIAIALFGTIVPRLGIDYNLVLQALAALVGAVAGAALTLRRR